MSLSTEFSKYSDHRRFFGTADGRLGMWPQLKKLRKAHLRKMKNTIHQSSSMEPKIRTTLDI